MTWYLNNNLKGHLMGSSQSKRERTGEKFHGPSHEDEVFCAFPPSEYQIALSKRVNKIMDERRCAHKARLNAQGSYMVATAGPALAEDKPPSYQEAVAGIHVPADDKPLLPILDHCRNGRLNRRNSI